VIPAASRLTPPLTANPRLVSALAALVEPQVRQLQHEPIGGLWRG
jgi:hypothetical protein